MFEASGLLFIYVETPLHAGTGRGLGAVDLPIQRERTTGYPLVQASSLKGRLRAEAQRRQVPDLTAIFGPEVGNASEHAGALAVGDARLLLFPVRSLAGVFAWTTSVDTLARFQRAAALAGHALPWSLPTAPAPASVLVSGDDLVAGDHVVLEEFSFQPERSQALPAIGQWLADNALPARPAQGDDPYAYWRAALPRKLCVLPEDAFRDFALYATEVQTHVRLDRDTKTVEQGGLWTTESLPPDTLLYAPLLASPSRNGAKLTASAILQRVADMGAERTQLGGDETTGQGIVALRFLIAAGKES
ncbi:MAG: type III-B CRISPR module RAMP protein Cmr4 [Chloroflexi bacterium]|nr:type III-B CRISPR module RAMP protein Cmr4 [Chloroflexota bacterium]